MKQKNNDSKVSIKYKVFGYFAIFIAITIGFLWFFQIVFLDDFYKMIKIQEIKNSAEVIEKAIVADNADEVLKNLAYQKDVSMVIINMDNDIRVSVETGRNSIIAKMPYSSLLNYATLAETNGGKYIELVSSFGGNEVKAPNFFFGGGNMTDSLIYAELATINEANVLIVLNTSISPVDATVNTIKIQLFVLTILLLLIATILALYTYKRISKPIMEINESAKELAKGNYDTQFHGEGYKEVAELSNTLNYASTELSKVDNLRTELIANISHDLRTPLTMISGYAEVMRDLPGENNPENAQVIIDEAARLTSLVNDVLDLSKLQTGTQELHVEPYSITDSIKEILKRFNKFVSKDGYTIEFNYENDVMIKGDELRISQVIYNLINNALTYTGEDKMVIINQKLVDDAYVRIEVCDHGVGISDEQLENIWDRYYKANNQHRRAVNGTGLGLSIVKTTLEAHNELMPGVARYGVESKQGENSGSIFYFEYKISNE